MPPAKKSATTSKSAPRTPSTGVRKPDGTKSAAKRATTSASKSASRAAKQVADPVTRAAGAAKRTATGKTSSKAKDGRQHPDAIHVLTEDHLAEPGEVAVELEEKIVAVEEPPAPVYDEGLGDLPGGYGDDALVALARDPYTLWCYWDYGHHTVQEAMRGLANPHAKLRVHEQGKLVRELDIALESRSFYINDLTPGRHYRVEIYFYGTDGGQHRLGKPSNTIGLPPRGPSPIIDDRFVVLPWGMPLARRHDLFARAQPAGGFSGEERDALHAASAGRPLGASENLGPGATGGGGSSSARPWSGTRYEGA